MRATIGLFAGSLILLAGCNLITGADGLTVASEDGGAGGAPSSSTSASSTSGAASSSSSSSSTSASSSSTSASSSSSSSSSGTTSSDPAQLCVDTINMYRATMGLPPYARWSDNEMCGGTEAQKDSMTMQAHSAFPSCGEWAQNECPGWPGPPEGMIQGCLAQMWAEGPGDFYGGHGHYINMSSTQYTKVSCGFYVLPNGDVWAVQDFQ